MAIEEKALRMPKQIKPGDTLGVVAPSMPVKPEEKEKLTAGSIRSCFSATATLRIFIPSSAVTAGLSPSTVLC